MNSYFYIIIVLLLAVFALGLLIYVSGTTKLKKFKEKMDTAESIIDENLNKKLELIITINASIKKVTGKKDYLKDYISIKDLIITNIEKDMKLEEAMKLINDLVMDFSELNKDNEFGKNIKKLREIDELLISAKNVFNQNAVFSNKLMKTFPYSLISKISGYRIRSFYSNNKTDESETF